MEITLRAELPDEQRRAIQAGVAGLRLLEDLLRWGAAQIPARSVSDVVVQDEYTHDVVIPYDDQLVLVFDST